MKQTINNGESGLSVRQKLNNMFTELYNSVTAANTQKNQTGSFTYVIPAGYWVDRIFVQKVSGSTSIKIGTTPGGGDICDTIEFSNTFKIQVDTETQAQTTLYIAATGVINIRYDLITLF